MTASNYNPSVTEDKTSVSLIGNPCGHHGQCTFYKAFRYQRPDDATNGRILMLGEFFFLRISPHDDPCIGELQLLWEDKQRNQLLSSTRLYFLPEQTPDGRQSHHGEHEVLAASEKVTLRLTDLVSWITHQVDWIAGLHYHWQANGTDNGGAGLRRSPLSSRAFLHNQNVMSHNRCTFLTSQRIISNRCQILLDSVVASATAANGVCTSTAIPATLTITTPPRGLDFDDVIEQKLKTNEQQTDLSTVVILSYSRYCRYRTLLRRVDGPKTKDFLRRPFVEDALVELGIPLQRNNRVNILFCRDSFDHEALLQNDLNCDHLAPKLKGRPRKRATRSYKSFARASSPESISSEENNQPSQPRRSRRAVTTAFVANVINYSEPRRSQKKRSKQPVKLNQSNKLVGQQTTSKSSKSRNSNRAHRKRTPTKQMSESTSNNSNSSNNSTGNETDASSSSVDANNNFTDATNMTSADNSGSNVNHELKIKVKTESVFLEELHKFMDERKTAIQRVPNLGFKKIDLYVFYTRAQEFGGYDVLTKQRLWKKLYDKMGGDKRSTSAATCTRRHYEKLLLPFERFLNGQPHMPKSSKRGGGGSINAIKSDDGEDDIENEEVDEEINGASDDDDKGKIAAPSLPASPKSLTSSNDRVISPDDDHQRLILKFSPTLNSNEPSKNKSKSSTITTISNSDLNGIKDELKEEDVNLSLISEKSDSKSDELQFSSFTASDDIKINIANLERTSGGEPKYKDRLITNENFSSTKQRSLSENDSSITIILGNNCSSPSNASKSGDRFGCGVAGIFPTKNSQNKVTARVYPTQRESSKPLDIYDFKENSNETTSGESSRNEILELQRTDNDNDDNQNSQSVLSDSPLDSIDTLICQMSSTAFAEKPKAATKHSHTLSKSVIKETEIQRRRHPLFVHEQFLPQRAYDSPDDILVTLKVPSYKTEPKQPQPAHCRSSDSQIRSYGHSSSCNSSSSINYPTTPSETQERILTDILDLSVKNRCLDSNRSSSPSTISLSTSSVSTPTALDILDLSVKKQKVGSEKAMSNSINNDIAMKQVESYGGSAKPNPTSLPTWRPHNSNSSVSLKKDLDKSNTRKIGLAESNEKSSTIVNSIRFRTVSPTPEASRNRFMKNASSSNNAKRKSPSASVCSTVFESSKFSQLPNKSSSGTSRSVETLPASFSASSQMISPLNMNSIPIPSISEYNPQLPSFRSPLWPSNWLNHSMAPQFTASPSSPQMINTANAAANFPSVLPQLFLQNAFLPNPEATALTNAYLSQALLDPTKLMDTYTSPLLIKSFLEQNALLNGNVNSNNFLQHLFTSSSK